MKNQIDVIKKIMQKNALWSEKIIEIPLSEAPFYMDVISPEVWLQFIFFPRIEKMLENKQEIPYFLLSPYFELAWKEDFEKYNELLNAIKVLEGIQTN